MRKEPVTQSLSPSADVWCRLKKNKAAMFGLAFIVLIVLVAVFADFLVDYDSEVIKTSPDERLLEPCAGHIFGTDANGRDLLARVVYGTRYSLAFGVLCVALAIISGAIFGATAAYFGGKVDTIITFFIDTLNCIPSMLLALSLVAVLGKGFINLLVAITITNVPGFARIIRSCVLSIVRQDYIEAAKAIGVPGARVISFHVLPNAVGLIIVNATMNVAGLIITAASLSYIGMGIQPPAPEWGAMLSDALTYLRTAPHVVLIPGMAIVLTALSFNLLGDGLSEALDPRMKD